jgi:hypothetical protein
MAADKLYPCNQCLLFDSSRNSPVPEQLRRNAKLPEGTQTRVLRQTKQFPGLQCRIQVQRGSTVLVWSIAPDVCPARTKRLKWKPLGCQEAEIARWKT